MENIDGHNQANENVIQELEHPPDAGPHIGHQAGHLGHHVGLDPLFNFRKVVFVVRVEKLHHPLVLAKGGNGPVHKLLRLGRQCVPEHHNTLHQLGHHHGNQGIDHQNAYQQGENHRQGVGKSAHLFGEPKLEKCLQRVAHRPKQIGNHTAINKGCQNGAQLRKEYPNALQTIQEEEKQDTQADGTKARNHGIKIFFLIGIFHYIHSFLFESFFKYTSTALSINEQIINYSVFPFAPFPIIYKFFFSQPSIYLAILFILG